MNNKNKKQPNKKEVSEPPSKRVAPAKKTVVVKAASPAKPANQKTIPAKQTPQPKQVPPKQTPSVKLTKKPAPGKTPPEKKAPDVKKETKTPIDKKSFTRIDAALPDSETKKSRFDIRAGKTLKKRRKK